MVLWPDSANSGRQNKFKSLNKQVYYQGKLLLGRYLQVIIFSTIIFSRLMVVKPGIIIYIYIYIYIYRERERERGGGEGERGGGEGENEWVRCKGGGCQQILKCDKLNRVRSR